MPKAKETVLEINLSALKQNFKYLKSKLQPSTKFMAVVKAFAYGSDAIEIAKYLETLGIDYFSVAYTSEGVALRKAGITTPILVLHPQAVNLKQLIAYCLEPSLYQFNVLNEFISILDKEHKTNYPVHIKLNTGLNRIGFSKNDCGELLKTLQNTKAIHLKGVFSHLAASEDINEIEFTKTQIKTFTNVAHMLSQQLQHKPLLHLCNTSGLLNYPEAHFNMVRSGIGLYGFGNSEIQNKNLKPIATLKSVISQIHYIQKGDTVGYNRAYKSNSPQKIATIPIGHADGITRQLGNGKGFVYINQKKAVIIGNVCMDMIMVNITEISCKEGDEVIIFDTTHTIENLASSINTISYETLASISQRVKRIFYRDK